MDDAEFERFVLETQEKALRLAYSYVKDWEEARDAVQEAFTRAYRKVSVFRGEASVATWFYRILANHCRDRLRRRKVRSWFSSEPSSGTEGSEDPLDRYPDPSPDPQRQMEQAAFESALAKALERLPRRQRQVFRMKTQAGLTLAEAAAAMGISVGAAKSHLFRATRTLQDALAPWRDGP